VGTGGLRRAWRWLTTGRTTPADPMTGLIEAIDDAVRTGRAGRLAEAAEKGVEVVARARDLAARDPGRYLPALQLALRNQGATLVELGRHREAVTVTEEAVGLARAIVAGDRHRYLPQLTGGSEAPDQAATGVLSDRAVISMPAARSRRTRASPMPVAGVSTPPGDDGSASRASARARAASAIMTDVAAYPGSPSARNRAV
jgi:hypothetical protein